MGWSGCFGRALVSLWWRDWCSGRVRCFGNLCVGFCLSACSGRMYYHFRPDYWFWIVIILGRKLMIAVTALMFNKNPAFQMAIALLVLFICYALQVHVQAV